MIAICDCVVDGGIRPFAQHPRHLVLVHSLHTLLTHILVNKITQSLIKNLTSCMVRSSLLVSTVLERLRLMLTCWSRCSEISV